MVTLTSLWLPVIVTTVVLFVASSVVWMLMPHHKGDWKKTPNEDQLLEGLRGISIEPGGYTFPFAAGWSDMKDPGYQAKYKQGPRGFALLQPAANMGKNLALQAVFFLIVSVLVAYLTSRTLTAGAEYLAVFRVAGTAAFMAYAFATVPHAIWFGWPWRATVMDAIDGLAYGLLTGGVYGWLWP